MPNGMTELKEFLSTPDNPISPKEMIDFWMTLTEEEKEYYRNVELK
jgi:hypothetical protein